MSAQVPAHGDAAPAWATRAVERSPSVQHSRMRSMHRAQQIVDAARRLIAKHGSDFTAQQLVKEAGIAIQTMYKHFASKDQVILAVLEDMISESASGMERAAAEITDPVERLRLYVYSVIGSLRTPAATENNMGPFIATEHWRLMQLYPDDVVRVTQPIIDLLLRDIRAAHESGSLAPADLEYGAWLGTQLLLCVYHHYVFAGPQEPLDAIAQRVWAFCYKAWGGTGDPERVTATPGARSNSRSSASTTRPVRRAAPKAASDAGKSRRATR